MVPGADAQRWVKDGVSGESYRWGRRQPPEPGQSLSSNSQGVPSGGTRALRGPPEPIETPPPTAHHPLIPVRIQAQESLRFSGFELRWWILLSAASENQLLKVGPFPKDQTQVFSAQWAPAAREVTAPQ